METSLAGALRRSGLPEYWARNYPCLRSADGARAGAAHLSETVATLPAGYRWAFHTVLLALPVVYRVSTGRRFRAGTAEVDRVSMARLVRLPGFAQFLRVSTALALYGALDGARESEPA